MKKLAKLFKRDNEIAQQYFKHPVISANKARDLDIFLDNLDRFRPSVKRLSVPVNKMIGQI